MTINFDAFPSEVDSSVIVITGTVSGDIVSLEVGPTLTDLVATDLAQQRFSVVVELETGRNEVVFQSYATGSTPVDTLREVIYLNKYAPELYHVKNSLDKHGDRLGFDRFLGEKNVSYKQRLLQASGGAPNTREGTQVYLATELGFSFSQDLIRVSVERTTYNRPKLTNPYVRITLDAFEYTANELVSFEGPVVFDSGYPYVTPQSTVSPFGNIKLLSETGEEISGSSFEYEQDQNRILLKDLSLAGKDLTLVYNIVVSFPTTSTISALKTAVEAGSDLLIEITPTDFHDGATSANWLMPLAWRSLPTREDNLDASIGRDPGVYVGVSEVKTFALNEFSHDLLNQDGSGLGTALERYVKELREVDRRTWGRIIPGRDGLRDENARPLDDHLPHLMDPVRGLWGTNEYNIHEVEYLGDGNRDPNNPLFGVTFAQWQSGTGTNGDLEPGVVRKELQSFSDLSEESKIPVSILYGVL